MCLWTGLGWLQFCVLHCLPNIAWADRNLAEAAGQSQPSPGPWAHGTPCRPLIKISPKEMREQIKTGKTFIWTISPLLCNKNREFALINHSWIHSFRGQNQGCLDGSFTSTSQVSATRKEETTKLFDQFKRRGLTRKRLETEKKADYSGCGSDSRPKTVLAVELPQDSDKDVALISITLYSKLFSSVEGYIASRT